jgi:hypothetical protein
MTLLTISNDAGGGLLVSDQAASRGAQGCIQIDDAALGLLQKQPRLAPFPPLLLEDEVMKLEFLFDIGLIHLECMVQLEGGIDAALLLHADVFNVAVA